MRVLITGASRGVGLEFTRQYANAGHQVVATCRNPDDSAGLIRVCGQFSNVEKARLDVGDDSSICRLADAMADAPIDLLINSAVEAGTASYKLENLDRSEWLRMFDVNCVGPVLLAAALRPALRQSTRPQVVGISSVKASNERNVLGEQYGYRSSKAGMNAAFRSMAIDLLQDGIAVYLLSPGWIDRGKRGQSDLSFRERLYRAKMWRAEFGGLSARQDLSAAVQRMILLIEQLEPDQSGGFFDHLGDPMPW